MASDEPEGAASDHEWGLLSPGPVRETGGKRCSRETASIMDLAV